jgi:hypothetical protein
MRLLTISLFFSITAFGQFAPPAGEIGTTAIHKDSSAIVDWAFEVVEFTRGPEDIENPDGLLASFGDSTAALGVAEGTSTEVVSLGDNGSITLTFNYSIRNEDGADFAVFENSFSSDYLELAHVEVSSDGDRFVRIPSISNIPTDEQIETFGSTDATLIHNLAGKYRQGYGTPFDLEDIADSTGIDLMDVNFVRIIDCVGSINPDYGTTDSEGTLINDPYKTDFESGGFDLDAVGVINSNNPSLSIKKEEKNVLSVYPNPTEGALNIQFQGDIKELMLLDAMGRIIYKGEAVSLNLRQMGLNAGTYFLQIVDSLDVVHQQRIMVVD